MSTEEDAPKEWFKVQQSANGQTSVTCSIQDGNLSVKWSVKTYPSSVKQGVAQARNGAFKALDDLKAALAEIQEAAS